MELQPDYGHVMYRNGDVRLGPALSVKLIHVVLILGRSLAFLLPQHSRDKEDDDTSLAHTHMHIRTGTHTYTHMHRHTHEYTHTLSCSIKSAWGTKRMATPH